MKKLTRAEIEKGLETLPISSLLAGPGAKLTHKQKTFARAVALGATKADAYRQAYNPTSKRTMAGAPYVLASDPRIQREIEAYTLAIEAEKHRTPAALRALVVQTLTETLINPDVKPAVRIQAAKILGTVTEVAAFTERKEVRTISSSEDARARVMAELRGLLTSQADDATIVEADSLLAELAGNVTGPDQGGNVTGPDVSSPGPAGNVTGPDVVLAGNVTGQDDQGGAERSTLESSPDGGNVTGQDGPGGNVTG